MKKGQVFKILGLAISVTTLLSACAANPKILPNETKQMPKSADSVTDVSHLTVDQRSQLYYSILLAQLAEKKQLLDIAQSNFQDALFKTQSPELAGHSTKIALFQKDYPAAEQALSIWQKSDPNSIAPKQIALLIALHKNQNEKAYQQLLSIYQAKEQVATTLNTSNGQPLISSVLSNNELETGLKELLQLAYWKTPDVSGLESQLTGMANLLERYNQEQTNSRYLAITQTAEAFLHLKSRSPLSKLERVHRLLDGVIEQNPNFVGAIETKVQALALLSEQSSVDYLQAILNEQALSKAQITKLANLAYKQKDFDSAIVGFKRILEVEPDNSEVQFLLAGSYFGNKQYEQSAELFYQLALDDYRKEASAFYCGDSAERVEDTVKGLTCFEMVAVGKYFLEARQRMATIYANQEMYKVGAQSLEKAQSLVDFNERQLLLKYEVNYLIEHQQYQLARKRLETAIQLEPHNGTIYYLQLVLADKTLKRPQFLNKVKELQQQAPDQELRKEVTFSAVSILTNQQAHQAVFDLLDQEVTAFPRDGQLLYARALANEPLKRYDRLEQDLRLLLSFEPDNHNAQNALGYTLADLNKNLPEAQKLIESAYEADPDNDAILDSMGWIQYRLGNLSQALKYIQQSYDKAPVPEIAAHLGEILWQLGQHEKAKTVWQKALQQEPNNPYIRDTLARFPEANLTP
ncbi:MAG: tetratricopeptide repeat protein [Gammaproteobacteria bacterium]|nr:tetratricopeptide repeat protein [Gammaproteobacteria bacterium]